ncbi:MAG: hypothetical protein PUF16_05800 [Lachnospiraceae bacterium]|nr:hypothetical protein [Lachnospiraceae bacterium]
MLKFFENVKNKARKNVTRLALSAGVVGGALTCTGVNAFAASTSGSTNASITESMVQAFTSIKDDILSAIAKVAPIALPVLGAGLLVVVGIKIFKKVTSKA